MTKRDTLRLARRIDATGRFKARPHSFRTGATRHGRPTTGVHHLIAVTDAETGLEFQVHNGSEWEHQLALRSVPQARLLE